LRFAPAGLSVGAIVGIVIGVLAVAALGSFGATVVWARIARQMKHKHGAHQKDKLEKQASKDNRNGARVVGDVMLRRLDVPH
jgi:transposase